MEKELQINAAEMKNTLVIINNFFFLQCIKSYKMIF